MCIPIQSRRIPHNPRRGQRYNSAQEIVRGLPRREDVRPLRGVVLVFLPWTNASKQFTTLPNLPDLIGRTGTLPRRHGLSARQGPALFADRKPTTEAQNIALERCAGRNATAHVVCQSYIPRGLWAAAKIGYIAANLVPTLFLGHNGWSDSLGLHE